MRLGENMKHDEIIKMIEGSGFINYGREHGNSDVLCFGKRLESGCECDFNNRLPGILVRYFIESPIKNFNIEKNIEFVLYGEANGVWVHLSLYSICADEFLSVLDRAESALSAMWNIGYKELSK